MAKDYAEATTSGLVAPSKGVMWMVGGAAVIGGLAWFVLTRKIKAPSRLLTKEADTLQEKIQDSMAILKVPCSNKDLLKACFTLRCYSFDSEAQRWIEQVGGAQVIFDALVNRLYLHPKKTLSPNTSSNSSSSASATTHVSSSSSLSVSSLSYKELTCLQSLLETLVNLSVNTRFRTYMLDTHKVDFLVRLWRNNALLLRDDDKIKEFLLNIFMNLAIVPEGETIVRKEGALVLVLEEFLPESALLFTALRFLCNLVMDTESCRMMLDKGAAEQVLNLLNDATIASQPEVIKRLAHLISYMTVLPHPHQHKLLQPSVAKQMLFLLEKWQTDESIAYSLLLGLKRMMTTITKPASKSAVQGELLLSNFQDALLLDVSSSGSSSASTMTGLEILVELMIGRHERDVCDLSASLLYHVALTNESLRDALRKNKALKEHLQLDESSSSSSSSAAFEERHLAKLLLSSSHNPSTACAASPPPDFVNTC
ncbi:hypothetical protein QOT17_010590 [Balamuthia mandrillaris]